MKIECLREKLQNAIQHAERSVSKNHNIAVLSCVLLSAKENSLFVRSTNLDIGVEIEIPAKVMIEGEVAIPGSVLASYISGISSEKNVILEKNEGNLIISSIIKAFPNEDFPSLPRVENGFGFSVDSKELAQGLKSVWYSASVSSMKPELSSVYIYNEEDYAVFVATDSFRLAEKKVKVKGYTDGGGILIPFKNVPEVIKIFEGVDGKVDVTFDKNQISFRYEGIYVISRVVNGMFPDYKQIIPKNFQSEVTILKQDLLNALKLSTVFSDKFNQISISVNPKDKIFRISTKNSDIGENTSTLTGNFSGDEVNCNFNHKYMADCFQSIYSISI